jgi:hypothetical protein
VAGGMGSSSASTGGGVNLMGSQDVIVNNPVFTIGAATGGLFTNSGIMYRSHNYSDGGPVWGAGTGTSDDINARLSNGEFVINAKATAKHRDLLKMINDNMLPAYASGGVVGTLPMPTYNNVLGKSSIDNSQSQTVNINVTGDISRQTRKEILSMIPSISAGVNSWNREFAS